MIPRILAAASLLLLSGCGPGPAGGDGVEIFDPELAAAVRSGRGDRAGGCGSRLNAEDRRCEAIALLARARPVPPVRRDPSLYTEALAERLDLRSFPSSLQPRMEDGMEPVLAALPFLTPVRSGFSVVSDAEDWFYAFRVVARGDFTGDGREDWLVFLDDESKEGTYRAYSVLVLDDAAAPGPIRAAPGR